jgi:hypothetical protein
MVTTMPQCVVHNLQGVLRSVVPGDGATGIAASFCREARQCSAGRVSLTCRTDNHGGEGHATESFDLTGKSALVTGGNSGLGLGFATGLAKAGASVTIWGRNERKNAAA